MKLFVINSDIDTTLAMELTTFFIECKMNSEKAVLIINSKSGNDSALNQIISAYQDSGVHLTAIGMGMLANCSSALFCMCDERILLPGTDFSIHPGIKNYYEKTGITREVFRRKCANNTCWDFSEDEIQKYNITTRSHEGWMDIVMQTLEKAEKGFSNYFSFTSEFNSESATNLILFLIYCKLHAKDGFVLINSGGGSIHQLSAILTAYHDSGVHITIVGTGTVGSCAAGLFCMADERILTPRTEFLIHHSSVSFDKRTTLTFPILKHEYESLKKAEKILLDAYTAKTGISREVFEEKCENGANWILTENEVQKYSVTTRSSEGWLDILAKAMKQEV